MASQYPDMNERRPHPFRTAMIVAGLAFLAGLALMAWVLTRSEPGKRIVQGKAPPATDLVAAGPVAPMNVQPVPPTIAPAPVVTPPDQGRIAELEARMARIDLRAAAAAGNAARAEGMLIAFAARRALDRGVALGYVEGELRDRFGASQPRAVGTIIAGAQQPVTLEVLSSGLETLRPKLAGAGADEGWWESTKRTLGSMIVVRREGSGSPAPDQRLERAMFRLRAGEVESAMAEVARLPGRTAAAPWLEQARRYVETHRALDVIEAAALTEGDAPTAAPAPDALPIKLLEPKEKQ